MIGWEEYLTRTRMRDALRGLPVEDGTIAGYNLSQGNYYSKPEFMRGIKDGWEDAGLGQVLVPSSGTESVFYRIGYARGARLWKLSVEEGFNVVVG